MTIQKGVIILSHPIPNTNTPGNATQKVASVTVNLDILDFAQESLAGGSGQMVIPVKER